VYFFFSLTVYFCAVGLLCGLGGFFIMADRFERSGLWRRWNTLMGWLNLAAWVSGLLFLASLLSLFPS
jgi:hypothetical protein